jgi:hypothetical protein
MVLRGFDVVVQTPVFWQKTGVFQTLATHYDIIDPFYL